MKRVEGKGEKEEEKRDDESRDKSLREKGREGCSE